MVALHGCRMFRKMEWEQLCCNKQWALENGGWVVTKMELERLSCKRLLV